MKLRLITGLLIVLLLLGGCNAWENAYKQAASPTFKVASIKGPSALGFIKAMRPDIKPSVRLGDTVKYTFEEEEDKLYAQLLEGEIDIAVVPTDMAARLYNNGARYQLTAINTGGYLYVLANNKTISSFSDLKGKIVQIPEKGSASDVIFRYLLVQNGVDPDKDLTLEYTASIEEQVQNALNETSKVMVLPEPWVSKILNENGNFKIVLDIQAAWARIKGSKTPLPQTCLIVKNGVAAQKPEEWSLFLDDYKDSIDWVNSKPGKTAKLLAGHDVGVPEEIAEEVISRSYLVYIDASRAKSETEKYLKIFLEISPELIGSKVPDMNFYYQKQKY